MTASTTAAPRWVNVTTESVGQFLDSLSFSVTGSEIDAVVVVVAVA